jgi:hypothetical protein
VRRRPTWQPLRQEAWRGSHAPGKEGGLTPLEPEKSDIHEMVGTRDFSFE